MKENDIYWGSRLTYGSD